MKATFQFPSAWAATAMSVLLTATTTSARGVPETVVHSFLQPQTTAPWSRCFDVPQFDPSLGTLLEVEVSVGLVSNFSFGVENLEAGPVSVLVTATVATFARSPYAGGGILSNSSPSQTFPLSLASFDGLLDFAGNSGFNRDVSVPPSSDDFFFVPGDPRFAEHVGSGYLSFCFGSQAVIQTNGASALFSNLTSSARLTVRYRFDRPDCNGNGTPDAVDVSSGGSFDCDGNGFPDECQHDHDSDGVPDSCDPQCLVAGPDADGDGILDLCDTAPDCDSNDIPDTFEIDRNRNGLKDTCEFTGDCNLNGLPDALDLLTGISDDLDGNDVPDECQTTGLGFFLDCQCQPHTSCAAVPNTTGQSARLETAGSCRVGLNQFSLLATHVPPNRPVLFFEGALAMPVQVGLGFRCVASPMTRLGVITADAQGSARFDVDFASLHGSGAIGAWDSRAFQVAFRDVGPAGPAIHFSDTIHLSFCP